MAQSQLKNLYFDIETVSDYSRMDLWLERRPKPEDVDDQTWTDEQVKKMALHPEGCQIVGLNIALGDGECKSGWVGEISVQTGLPYSERDLLVMWWSWAAGAARLIGYNCNRFDLPVIYSRSAMLGVAPTLDLTDVKPWQSTVLDVMERRFKGQPREQYLSLKALRRLLGFTVPDKYAEVLDNTGGDVESLYLRFLASDDAEALRLLKLYGELDVWTTRALASHWSGYFYQRIE